MSSFLSINPLPVPRNIINNKMVNVFYLYTERPFILVSRYLPPASYRQTILITIHLPLQLDCYYYNAMYAYVIQIHTRFVVEARVYLLRLNAARPFIWVKDRVRVERIPLRTL